MRNFTTMAEDGTLVDVYLDYPGAPFPLPREGQPTMLYLVADCPGLPCGLFDLDSVLDAFADSSFTRLELFNSEEEASTVLPALTIVRDELKEVLEWAVIGAQGLPSVGSIGARSRPSQLAAPTSSRAKASESMSP